MSILTLQTFQNEGPEPSQFQLGFEQGVIEGLERARKAAGAEQIEGLNRLNSTVSDLAFKSAELKHQLLIEFGGLFEKVCSQLLPEMINPACAAHIFAEVHKRAEDLKAQTVCIEVCSDFDAKLLEGIEFGSLGISLAINENLNSGEAVVRRDATETFIDIAAVIENLRNALSELANPQEQRVSA